MFHRSAIVILLLLFAFIAQSKAQTADEILGKYIAATGGAEKWKSVQTFAMASRSEAFSFDLYWKKPNRVRIDTPFEFPPTGVDIRSFDGTTGWRLNPMEGSDKPRLMSSDETIDLLLTADRSFWFIDYKAKRYAVELLGKESANGNLAFKLKVTRPNGEMENIYIDMKSFLEVKRVRNVRAPWGEDRTIVTIVGDYRAVGGLLLPHSVGGSVREYKVNIPMEESVFKMPGGSDDFQESDSTDRKVDDLAQRLATPDQRADLLKQNPKADLNGDGILSLEEAWVFFKKAEAASRLLVVGTSAPDWVLKDADDRVHRLSDYRGKVVVMDFWAVWCVPCHRAMPSLQKLHNDFSKRGLVVLGISTNEHGGDPVQLMKDRGYSYGLMLHGETISGAYGLAGMPTVYVVGIDGRIIHSGFGANAIAEERRRNVIEAYLIEHKM